jgi:hypothetical protein
MQTKNKIKYLILATVLIYLILPQPAFAFVFDYFTAALEGVEETAGTVIQWEMYIALFLMIALILVGLSAWALETATEHPEWLSVKSDMVQAGWQFTSGLANLFIVLALIIIAFGFILKIESLQAKKALPRLIIAALLVNFSLVFVGGLIDIANILYNTILVGNEGLPFRIIDTLGGGIKNIIGGMLLYLGILGGVSMIPFAAPFAQLTKLVIFTAVGLAYVPTVATWLINGLLAMMMAGIFFLYAFLFAARVYIIQLLAMVSPIFFLCWALPPLKKYWDEWFGHLMEWLFFGVILFFFLVVGLKGAQALMPSSAFLGSNIPIWSLFTLKSTLSYYFFLFIYLTVISAWVTMRIMPQIGKALVEQGKQFGGQLWAMGAKPFGRAVGKDYTKYAAEIEKRDRAGEKVPGLAKTLAKPAQYYYRAFGTTPLDVALKEEEEKAKKIASMSDVQKMTGKIKGAMERGDYSLAGDTTLKAVERGGSAKMAVFKDIIENPDIDKSKLANLIKALRATGKDYEAENLVRASMNRIDDTDIQELGFESSDRVLRRTTASEIPYFSGRFATNPAQMSKVVKADSPQLLAGFGMRFESEFIDPYSEDVIENLKTNPDYLPKKSRAFIESSPSSPTLGFGELLNKLDKERKVAAEVSAGGRRRGPGETTFDDFGSPPSPPAPTLGGGVGGGIEEELIRSMGRLKKTPERTEEKPFGSPGGRVEKSEEGFGGKGKSPETRGDWMYEYQRTEVDKQLESIERGKKEDGQVHPALIKDVINRIKDNADALGIDRKQINLSEDQIEKFASKDKDFRTYIRDLLEKAKK